MANTDVNIHVGKQLRLRRTMLGLSQEAVGKGIGITSQQVQKYEKGTNSMTSIRIYEFARFLKVPPSYFFEGLDKPHAGKLATGVAEEAAEFEGEKTASDRESIEALKSFRRIKDPAVRKRVADLLRTMSIKEF